jgi:hypothetical protein
MVTTNEPDEGNPRIHPWNRRPEIVLSRDFFLYVAVKFQNWEKTECLPQQATTKTFRRLIQAP